ncbi:MAG: cupredoxin domain-containing protein [Chthoniobacterales bacterium]
MMANILQQPEYIHVLINPLPIYGLAGGLIGLFIAICQRSRRATIAALVVVLVSAASAWPVAEFGRRSYDGVLAMADQGGRAWLTEHRDRAEHLIWFFYALALLSVLGLILPAKWPKASLPMAIAVLSLGLASLGAGGYIAYAGGRIRHREFRLEPPPKTAAEPTPAQGNSNSAAQAAAQVTIATVKFSPATIEIKNGATVEWINNDLTPHTVTSQSGGELNSGSIEPGASWSHTFVQPGSFPYYCTYHTEMTGTVTVR